MRGFVDTLKHMIRLHQPHHMLTVYVIKRAFPSCWAINDHHNGSPLLADRGDRNLSRPARPGIHASCMVQALFSSHSLSGTAERQAGRPESDLQQLGSQAFQTPRTGCSIRRAPSSRRYRFFLKGHAPSANPAFPLAFAYPLTASSLQRSQAPRLDLKYFSI